MKKAARAKRKPAKASAQRPKRKTGRRKPVMRHSREGWGQNSPGQLDAHADVRLFEELLVEAASLGVSDPAG